MLYSIQVSELSQGDRDPPLIHTDQTQRHWLPNPHPPRDPTHTSGLRFIHTPSPLTHTGRGQSNKLGVDAVVIRGLSMVREPLRCFPKCSPVLQLFIFPYRLLHIHREARRFGWKEEAEEAKERESS